jgi:hypothetical protein
MEPDSVDTVRYNIELHFFDHDAVIRSDSAAYIDRFTQMYRCFRTQGTPSPHRPRAEYVVLTGSDNAWGQPILFLDGQLQRLNNLTSLEGYIYDGVLNAIVAAVRSHFLIHAGAVSRDGQGIVISADAGHGKTTLVLELVRRGFRFLSDEIAALGRADAQVHPFPRSLRLRRDTLALTGFPQATEGTPEWLGKLLLDIEDLQPGSLGQAVPIRHIIILKDPAALHHHPVDQSADQDLGILVDRTDDALLAAVRQIEGVAEAHPTVERGYPTIRLRAARRMPALAQVEAICQEQQILVLDINKRAETRPSFHQPARLEPIANSQAVMELLRRFQGGHKSALLQEEFDGSSAQLFFELAALVSQARCHQLFVGHLTEIADLVCGLVEPPSTSPFNPRRKSVDSNPFNVNHHA